MSKLITAEEISKQHKLSYQTVNYYTNIGLLHWEKRQGNRRLYDKTETDKRLKKIAKLKDKGFPLKLIKQLTE